ncbi:ATP-NAD kinase-like domain-containing protein [Cokeromyces recurvatus]|uniref:ATP-NAD kinase-like domain-containing protein n=1 Tax=Cokeromyces recurvatus TaxID=90255 RepID=UPI002220FB1A|nr:ATP-NAD kinase-like domain-containing protein [Cokeromyces recurvatus]KAI7899695.1 ATP-NAD kinase-like domain-containing protein [Cokeromyces recurvatus]
MINSVLVYNKDNNLTKLILDKDQLRIETVDNNREQIVLVVQFEFIYGIDFDEETLIIHYVSSGNMKSEPIRNDNNQQPNDIRQWELNTLQYNCTKVKDNNNDALLSSFITSLRERALPHYRTYSKTKVFVILNPTSGSQRAETDFIKRIKPMLLHAGFLDTNITKINTKRNGETRALAKDLGKQQIKLESTIIISMGGDGTLHEVVNGLVDAITIPKEGQQQQQRQQIRLGVIPAGSGNAFALGMGIQSIEQATLKIIKQEKESPFYMIEAKMGFAKDWPENCVYDNTDSIRLLVVMSWGFHAQVVSKSRYLRYFMGNARFSWVAMYLLTFLKQYQGDLLLKNAKKYNRETHQFDGPKTTCMLDDKQFTYFVVSKQDSLEKGFRVAPFASPLTEEMDIIMLRNETRDKLTKVSLAAFQNGQHIDIEGVEYFKASELLLRVKDKAELCLDGEIHELQANGIIHLQAVSSSTEQAQFTVFI